MALEGSYSWSLETHFSYFPVDGIVAVHIHELIDK
jgi:hypothetical protein